MIYHAVQNRCLVNLGQLGLPVSDSVALTILKKKCFIPLHVDVVNIATSAIGKTYCRGARLSEAPNVFDCSSLVKWVYGQMGVWLPRRSIQQREYGCPVQTEDLQFGDLIFCSSWIDRYIDDPRDGVGHVGIFIGNDEIIHAANKNDGVVKSPIGSFMDCALFRGARRIADFQASVVLELPPNREVETSDDIKWIILQNLS